MQLEVRPTGQVDTLMVYLALPLPGIHLDMFRVPSFTRPIPNSHVYVFYLVSVCFRIQGSVYRVRGTGLLPNGVAGLVCRPTSVGTAPPRPCEDVLQCSFLRRPPENRTYDKVVLNDFLLVMVRDLDRWLYSIPRRWR